MTPELIQWAGRWGVGFDALADLAREFGTHPTDPTTATDDTVSGSEAWVQQNLRLRASGLGKRLFRNNVGGTYTPDGGFIRYGLANDSKAVNTYIKSSDLIGIDPLLIEPHHVGATVGRFMAIEVKRRNWSYSGTPEERAQLRFLELINSMGGFATFANNDGAL